MVPGYFGEVRYFGIKISLFKLIATYFMQCYDTQKWSFKTYTENGARYTSGHVKHTSKPSA